MSLGQFIDFFDPNQLRESHTLELKLKPDQKKCTLPQPANKEGCSHKICKDWRKTELASDFSQFANSDGGYLIFGVSESKGQAQVAGLDNISTTRRSIENAIKECCEPAPLFESDEFKYEGKSLLVFRIFASAKPIWVKSPNKTLKIVRRIDETKLILGPIQTEEFITDMSRANQIRLKALYIQENDEFLNDIELVGGVVASYNDLVAGGGGYGGGGEAPRFFRVDVDRIVLTARNTDDFELKFEGNTSWHNDCLNIPYSAIRHVWRTAKGRIGLALELQITMVDSEFRVSKVL